jgi:hypothetical protein
MVVKKVLGRCAMLIVLHFIRVQRCFVSIMRMKILGLDLNMDQKNTGLAILTCNHMEEVKVPSSMAGSQDALLPIPIGKKIDQTMPITMKIMQEFMKKENGTTLVLHQKISVAVSTNHLLLLQVQVPLLHHLL